jgi:hypothetical protein
VSTGKSTAEEVFVTTLREKLIEAHSDGTFLQAIFEGGMRLDDNQQAIIAAELVALHNEGLIDVIDAFKSLNNDNSGRSLSASYISIARRGAILALESFCLASFSFAQKMQRVLPKR